MPKSSLALHERFEQYVERIPFHSCWEWGGYISPLGYGKFNANRRQVMAHRYSYLRYVGEIPDGLTIDHLCRNRSCVNPAHLEPVTQRENVMRGLAPASINSRKATCKNGHPFDAIWRSGPGRIVRACRVCRRAR